MTTPTFDTIEAQASYGIGLQVGQQLSESGWKVCYQKRWWRVSLTRWKVNSLLFRLTLFTAHCVKFMNELTLCVARVSKRWRPKA